MSHNTLLNPRLLAQILCFAVIALPFFVLPAGETSPIVQGVKTPGYCMSESGGSVYFSSIYDLKLNQPVRISTNVIAREFVEYLKGRYDVNPQGNYPASCPVLKTLNEAEASKRDSESKARQANKQVVQVDWTYVVDPEYVAASYSHMGEDVVAVAQAKRKPTHTYCLSDSAQGTLYTAGPVDTGMAVNMSLWYRGFDQHLKQKYSFRGQVYCNMGSPQEVGRLVEARVGGARAAGKKIVDTGWKFDTSAVATNNPRPAQRDDDPEPVHRPAPPNPSRQQSDEAMKEAPSAIAFCEKDPALAAVFNCRNCFPRVVYNYRMAHLNEPVEPLASLMAANKLNCAECIDNVRVGFWVQNHAAADKLSPQATNCVTQNVIVTLYKTPQAKRLNEFYKQAVAACK